MLSNKAGRTLLTAIIIAFDHAMFENTGSVTGVTAWCVWDAMIADQEVIALSRFRVNRLTWKPIREFVLDLT